MAEQLQVGHKTAPCLQNVGTSLIERKRESAKLPGNTMRNCDVFCRSILE